MPTQGTGEQTKAGRKWKVGTLKKRIALNEFCIFTALNTDSIPKSETF